MAKFLGGVLFGQISRGGYYLSRYILFRHIMLAKYIVGQSLSTQESQKKSFNNTFDYNVEASNKKFPTRKFFMSEISNFFPDTASLYFSCRKFLIFFSDTALLYFSCRKFLFFFTTRRRFIFRVGNF